MPELRTNEERRAEGRSLRADVPKLTECVDFTDQTERDHAALEQAVADGRIDSVRGR